MTTVGADGLLYPCHRFVGMSGFVVGNVCDGPDFEAMKQFWRDYDAVVGERCSQCWAQVLCKRPCPWLIATESSSFVSPEEKFCERIRHGVKRAAYVHYCVQTRFPNIAKFFIYSDRAGYVNAEFVSAAILHP